MNLNDNSPIPLWVVLTGGIVVIGSVYVVARTLVVPQVVGPTPTQNSLTPAARQRALEITVPSAVTSSALPSPVSATSASVDTSGWKVYRNTKYGFEFLYPPGTVVEEQPSGGAVGLLTNKSFESELLVYDPKQDQPHGGFFQTVDIYRKPVTQTLPKWFGQNIDFQGEANVAQMNGYDALWVAGGPSDGLGVLNSLFLSYDDTVVELDVSGLYDSVEPTLLQKNLFGSFRFD